MCGGEGGAGRYTCVCVFVCFFLFSLCGCSCDDVGATASRPLVDAGDLQGDGDERTQHHLRTGPAMLAITNQQYQSLDFGSAQKHGFYNICLMFSPFQLLIDEAVSTC